MKKYFYLILLFPLSFVQAQAVDLPLDHWAYEILERFHTRGYIHDIKQIDRPYTRMHAASQLEELIHYYHDHTESLDKIEQAAVIRLSIEFSDELKILGISAVNGQKEKHLYSWYDKSRQVHFDAVIGFEHYNKDKSDNGAWWKGQYGGILRGYIGKFAFYSDNRIIGEKGRGPYIKHYNPDIGYPQNASKDGMMAIRDKSISYLSYSHGVFRIKFGRDQLFWGPSHWGSLVLSNNAPAFDMIHLTANIGQSQFSWFHGELRSGRGRKWLTGHRLSLKIKQKWDLGICETLIYGGRSVEQAYLNPVMPFLIAEHTLGDRDNLGIGFDITYSGIRNVKLYTEIFIDDLSSPEKLFDDSWDSKVAYTIGMFAVNPLKIRNADFRFEYTKIKPYVYSHIYSLNIYEHYNSSLGYHLQPNSDALHVQFRKYFSFSWWMSLYYTASRQGEGDRNQSHRENSEYMLSFLDGIVTSYKSFEVTNYWEIKRDAALIIKIGIREYKNIEKVPDKNKQFFYAETGFVFNW